MKKFYSILVLILVLSISLIGQSRIYPPNLRAPLDNAEEQNPDIILDWDAVTGQTTNITYEVQLATQADFSDAVTFDRTDVTALLMNQLIFGQLYYWQVKAYDDEEPSDWSEAWSFRVTGSVNFTDPDIDEEGYAIVLLEWDAISGLNNYQLQIDTTYEWNNQADITGDDIFGAAVLASDDMWFVGEGGMIQHFDGSVWSSMDAGVTEDLNSMVMVDASSGFAVGAGGTALIYNGTDWTTINTGTDKDLNDVSFIDTNNGWAVGEDGTILNYKDGTWASEISPTSELLTGVYALSNNNVWACGAGKEVLHYNGTEWTSEIVGTRDHNDIWFVDDNNGWVVGKSGKVFYYNGTGWNEQKSGITKDIFSVCFNGMNGYAVADDGIMLNFIGGWRIVSSEATNELNAVSVKADAGLIGGNSGTVVLMTEDGFNSPYLRTLNVNYDSASFEITNLLYGTKSYYRMRALHDSDTTEWSGGRSLITYPSPELDKPNNGSDGTDLIVTFKWDEYDGSTDYFFQIADNEEFSNPYNSDSDSTSTSYHMKRFDQDFFWRVKATHAADESDYSDTWSITTANEVSLSNPNDSEVDVPFCPSYEWDEIIGVANYEIWIDKDADFNNPLMGVTNTASFQCNEPLERKMTYYWKVRATTTVDTSDWSEVWSFTVEGYAGIGDNNFTSELVDIYPNPSDGEINLIINNYANDTYNISIVDMTGKLIYEESMNCKAGENAKVIQLAETQKGLYMLNIRKKDQVVSKKLFVK